MSTQREAIARIEEQLEDVIEHVRRIEKNTAITNGRISSLERWRAGIVGGGTLLTALAGSSAVWVLIGAQSMPMLDGKKFAYTKAGKAKYLKTKKRKDRKKTMRKSTKRSY